MITARNEYEPVEAWEHIAGSSLGTWTSRETATAMLRALDSVSQFDTKTMWRDIAECSDDDEYLISIQEDIADELTYYMPMPAYCAVTLEDGEWRVQPYIDDELERVDDIPDDYIDDHVLLINDHGNVTCLEFDQNAREYKSIWGMV